MVMTDPIADMLTRIRNANNTLKEEVSIPTSTLKVGIAGLRVYAKVNEIPRVLNGLGIVILSTSQGLMTDKEARAKQVGGEVLAYIW